MKAVPFDYVRARSVAEACELLRRDGNDAKLIAGGQSLVPMMAMRLARPARLIDINGIAALKLITLDANAARIGACARQCDVERDAALAALVPLLKRALAWVGHVQTRNRGTVGGSLAHADPAAELPLVAQVLGASVVLRSTAGARKLSAAEFFTGPLTTAIEPQECLEGISWPAWPERRTGCAFTEVSRRHGDFAIVAAAAQLALDEDGKCVRASLGLAGGSIPLAFPQIAARLAGTRVDDNVVAGVAHDAAAAIDPGSDLHASAGFRRHLAEVLAARVLRAACDEARARP